MPESYRDRFASLYGETLTMDDQLKAFAVLKYDVDNEVNEDEAMQLINELYERRDLSWTLRDEIGTYLAGRAGAGATSNAAPVAAASAPAPTPVPKRQPILRRRTKASRKTIQRLPKPGRVISNCRSVPTAPSACQMMATRLPNGRFP